VQGKQTHPQNLIHARGELLGAKDVEEAWKEIWHEGGEERRRKQGSTVVEEISAVRV